MRGWSFPLGRWMGVDIRIHAFFVLLFGLCLVAANLVDAASWRGTMLWLLLLGAVFVRESARGLVAAWYGLQVRNMVLLPTGGLFAYATPESNRRAGERDVLLAMALAGPAANLAFAGIVAALILGSAPGMRVLVHPWITPAHLMRTTVWLNVFLAVLHLVPAYPLDMGRVLREQFASRHGADHATRAAAGVGQILTVVILVAGAVLREPWIIMASVFIFIGVQVEEQGVLFQSVVDTVRMRDVMLTSFSTLSPSDTLEDALFKAIHSLQDDFPVVRGRSLVGIVSRQSILNALRSDGNGYVQAVMSRAFQVAQPDDSLGAMIRRITGGRGLSLIPVTEGENIVGIVTLQNLMHSMGLLSEQRKLQQD